MVHYKRKRKGEMLKQMHVLTVDRFRRDTRLHLLLLCVYIQYASEWSACLVQMPYAVFPHSHPTLNHVPPPLSVSCREEVHLRPEVQVLPPRARRPIAAVCGGRAESQEQVSHRARAGTAPGLHHRHLHSPPVFVGSQRPRAGILLPKLLPRHGTLCGSGGPELPSAAIQQPQTYRKPRAPALLHQWSKCRQRSWLRLTGGQVFQDFPPGPTSVPGARSPT